MRCPLCGAENADSQLNCWSCGAWLPTRRVEDQVDQMMERLSAAASEQADRESLFMHALEMTDEQPDISWLADAEARLLASRSVDAAALREKELAEARAAAAAAAAAARRISELDARAAAFVSNAYETIDFPPVGAVTSPRSDPMPTSEGYRRSYEQRDEPSRPRKTRGEGTPASGRPRKRKRGPRFAKSVVPVVAPDTGQPTKRRTPQPVESDLPPYAAETRLDDGLDTVRVLPTEAPETSSTGKLRRQRAASAQEPTTGRPATDATGTTGELRAPGSTGTLSGTAALRVGNAADGHDEPVPAGVHDPAHPFGLAHNLLVEDSPFEAFPEGVAEETADEVWQEYLEAGLGRDEEPVGEGGETSPAPGDAAEAQVDDAYEGGVPEAVADEDAAYGSTDAAVEQYVDELIGSLIGRDTDEVDADELPEAEREPAANESTDTVEDASDTDLSAEPAPAPETEEPADQDAEEPASIDDGQPAEDLDEYDGTGETDERTTEQTVLRPQVVAVQEPLDNGGHFVIRNTRDYDHDAQSTNLVNAGDQFDTLTESRDARKLRNDPYARSKRRGYVPGEGNSRGLLRPILAILLVAAVLSGGAAVLTYGLEMWGGVSVPLVTGYQQGSAEQRLEKKGFVAVIEAEPADDAIGVVISQSPEPGARAPEGSEVILRVATNRTVPDVMGMPEAEARLILEKSGAEHIVSVVESSTEPEGTVIAVNPGVGKPFVSRAELRITIAGPYIVPDVLTKKEQDAIEAIEQAGFVANVTYVTSDETVRTVVETIPAAGTAYDKGATVEVHVSAPYPSDPYHLAEFFDHSSQDDNEYLLRQGYSFEGGAIAAGQAQAIYTSTDKGNISFSATPHAHQLKVTNKDEANALASGMPFSGARVDLPAWLSPGSYDESALMQVAEVCGFSGLTDSCNNLTITLPAGVTRLEVPFGCISGKMGDLVWTVLVIGADSGVRVSATCAKEGVYVPSELLGFGGNVSQYAAYQEVYASKEFEPKPEPKPEEGKDADKKDDTAQDADKDKEAAGADAAASEGEGGDATGEQHDTAAA